MLLLSILASLIFSAMAALTLLVACGLPFGELTMGGQNKILPPQLRKMAVISVIIQCFGVFVLLQAGSLVPPLLPARAINLLCILFALYLTLNTVTNLLSKSKKERCVMTPCSLVAALCFWGLAFGA